MGHHSGNTRNGISRKALEGDFGELELETPRDRNASFEPKIVAKGQTRFTGFDDKITPMYARGMSTREIQGHLEEIYGIEVSAAILLSEAPSMRTCEIRLPPSSATAMFIGWPSLSLSSPLLQLHDVLLPAS
ncbi:MAG: hypothetical protein NVS1B11_33210 [Terriglobales bacterium]